MMRGNEVKGGENAKAGIPSKDELTAATSNEASCMLLGSTNTGVTKNVNLAKISLTSTNDALITEVTPYLI